MTRIPFKVSARTARLIGRENVATSKGAVIELVKNEYGTDQGVTFNIANKEGTIYHVSVNDAETTAVLTWYTVDVSTNTVTQ